MLQNYKTASLSKIKSEFKGMQEINETRPNSLIDTIVSNNGYIGKMPDAIVSKNMIDLTIRGF